jgi:hypothetical protein
VHHAQQLACQKGMPHLKAATDIWNDRKPGNVRLEINNSLNFKAI